MAKQEHGSLQNLMYSGAQAAPPEVGMGCTIISWTDRYAATIVEIVYFKSGARCGQIKAVVVQEDKATRTDGNGMSECQTYSYEPNPQATRQTFKADKNGKIKGLLIGIRRQYHDFSF